MQPICNESTTQLSSIKSQLVGWHGNFLLNQTTICSYSYPTQNLDFKLDRIKAHTIIALHFVLT